MRSGKSLKTLNKKKNCAQRNLKSKKAKRKVDSQKKTSINIDEYLKMIETLILKNEKLTK